MPPRAMLNRRMGPFCVTGCGRKSFLNATNKDLMINAMGGAGTERRFNVKGVSDLVFGKIGATVSNELQKRFGKNPDARPIAPGEKHIVLPTDFGLTRANFAGPGTRVNQRVKRGDVGVDGPRGIDSISKTHDIDYVNARKESDIRKADRKMVSAVRSSTANKKIRNVVIAALKAKMAGEDSGAWDVNKFTESVPPEGIGKGPASRLLKEVIRKQKKCIKKTRKRNRKRKGGNLFQVQGKKVKRTHSIMKRKGKKRSRPRRDDMSPQLAKQIMKQMM